MICTNARGVIVLVRVVIDPVYILVIRVLSIVVSNLGLAICSTVFAGYLVVLTPSYFFFFEITKYF